MIMKPYAGVFVTFYNWLQKMFWCLMILFFSIY